MTKSITETPIVRALASQEALNRYNQAVDGLRNAISYTKTYSPPAAIPDNYTKPAELLTWAMELVKAIEGWVPVPVAEAIRSAAGSCASCGDGGPEAFPPICIACVDKGVTLDSLKSKSAAL